MKSSLLCPRKCDACVSVALCWGHATARVQAGLDCSVPLVLHFALSPVCLFMSLSLSLCVCISVSPSLCVSPSLSLPQSLPLSVSPSASPPLTFQLLIHRDPLCSALPPPQPLHTPIMVTRGSLYMPVLGRKRVRIP